MRNLARYAASLILPLAFVGGSYAESTLPIVPERKVYVGEQMQITKCQLEVARTQFNEAISDGFYDTHEQSKTKRLYDAAKRNEEVYGGIATGKDDRLYDLIRDNLNWNLKLGSHRTLEKELYKNRIDAEVGSNKISLLACLAGAFLWRLMSLGGKKIRK